MLIGLIRTQDTEYSAGAIYLAIQNLPRTDRYLMENVLLVAMIPGPKEPEKDINTAATN